MTYRVAVRYHDCSIKHLVTAIHIPSVPYDHFAVNAGYGDGLHVFPGSPVISTMAQYVEPSRTQAQTRRVSLTAM